MQEDGGGEQVRRTRWVLDEAQIPFHMQTFGLCQCKPDVKESALSS